MKILSFVLSGLLIIQSTTLWAQDSKGQMIEESFKNFSYELSTQNLSQEKIQEESQAMIGALAKKGVSSKDLIDYLGDQLGDKKTKAEFKQTIKMIKKQKLSKEEAFKRILPYFDSLEASGASFRATRGRPVYRIVIYGAGGVGAVVILILLAAVIYPDEVVISF